MERGLAIIRRHGQLRIHFICCQILLTRVAKCHRLLSPIVAITVSRMTSYEHLLQELREQGHRLTPQRLIVLRVVAEGQQHMGVDEVFREAQAAYPFMDLATVYRTLRLFKQVGLVTEVAIGDRMHYELTHPEDRHHHMVCRVCHGAFNLSPHYLEEFNNTLVNDFGFVPDLDHFTITGVCVNCRSGAARPSGGVSDDVTTNEDDF